MEGAGIARLMARHLRLHAALLALRSQATEPEAGSAEGWLRWLARREALLHRIAQLGGPGLAAETVEVVWARESSPALVASLVALWEREVELLQAAARDNARLEAAARARYGGLLARLRGAGGARAARRGYGGGGGGRARVRGEG